MFWQELAVAVIVGLSVVWLVRHMRSILVVPSRPGSDAGASCHGCDDCGEEAEVSAPSRTVAAVDVRRSG